MMGGAVLLGASFIGLGYLSSAVVRERATAAGLAIGLWLGFVVLYDLALLGVLVADTGQAIGPGLFSALMLLNPTDLYRILTLTGSESVSQAAGMVGTAGLGPLVLLGAMAAWVAAPLAATVLVFRRREL
jgi:Cu-processing system permease protein